MMIETKKVQCSVQERKVTSHYPDVSMDKEEKRNRFWSSAGIVIVGDGLRNPHQAIPSSL